MHKLIFKNTFYQTLTRIVTSGIGFLITIIIARNFGVLGFGEFTKVTAFVALFFLITDFGLNAIYLKENDEKPHFKDLFYLRIILSLVLIVLANLIVLILPYNKDSDFGFSDQTKLGVFIFSFSILFQGILYSSSAIFQKKIKYNFLLISSGIGSFLTLILVFIDAYFLKSVLNIYLAFIFGAGVTALISIFLAGSKITPLSLNLKFTKSLFKEALPIGLMLIFNLIYFRIDIFLLSIFRSTTDVGIYGLSYKFFDFLIALPLFLSNSIYPVLIGKREDKNAFFQIVKKYFIFSLAFSVFLIFIFWFTSPLFSLIKKDFIASVLPFRILLLSLPLFFTTSILQWTLIAQGKQKFLMYVYLFCAILNICLNIIFIPNFGYIASAIITGVSELIVFVFLLLKFISTRKSIGIAMRI